jgi:hypothetical protein
LFDKLADKYHTHIEHISNIYRTKIGATPLIISCCCEGGKWYKKRPKVMDLRAFMIERGGGLEYACESVTVGKTSDQTVL